MPRSSLISHPARSLGAALLATTAACALVAPAALATTTTIKPSGASIGKITFSGALSGTVSEPSRWSLGYNQFESGCQITSNPTDLNLLLYNAKLKLNGKSTVINGGSSNIAAFLGVDVAKHGNTEAVATTTKGSDAPAAVGIGFAVAGKQYQWLTNAGLASLKSAGTVTTNAKGTAGSFNVTLVPAGTGETSGLTTAAKGLLKIKASWSSCAKSGTA